MVWAHFAASKSTTSSKQPRKSKSDLKFQISDPIYIMLIHVHIVVFHLAASEATTASKQPQRSNLTSNLMYLAMI